MLVIGGFALNKLALEPVLDILIKFYDSIEYIDINELAKTSNPEEIINQIETNYYQELKLIFAYSCGGLLALKLAIRHPQQVKQIIMLNSTPRFIESENWPGIKPIHFKELESKLTSLSKESFGRYFLNLANYPYISKHQDSKNKLSDAPLSNLLNLLTIINNNDFRHASVLLRSKLVWINSDQDLLASFITSKPGKKYLLTQSSHLTFNQKTLQEIIEEIVCQTNPN